MKKVTVLMFALVLGTAAFAQKFVPNVKANSIISYTYTIEGQDLPMTLTFNSLGAPTKMDWSIDGIGSGSFQMSSKALESGKGMALAAPTPDQLTTLPDYKTIACISKSAFNDMIKNKAFEYDDLKFSVTADTASINLNNKPLDVIHAVATNGKGELWILNNPAFPLVCRTKDSAQGADLRLVDLK